MTGRADFKNKILRTNKIDDVTWYTFATSIEKRPSPHIPAEHSLPLKINDQSHVAESGESNVWKAVVQD